MEWESDERELKAVGAKPLPDGRSGLRIHGWEIESRKHSILTSLQLQQWEEKLETSHLPEMIILYEDELADNGVSLLTVKVVMLFWFLSSHINLSDLRFTDDRFLCISRESCQVVGSCCCVYGRSSTKF
uniref:Uncharacterized protein n=1 Tax=Solanum lycopersicum TaxID=4081 RepID=A0A3Q7ES83_SOLLC